MSDVLCMEHKPPGNEQTFKFQASKTSHVGAATPKWKSLLQDLNEYLRIHQVEHLVELGQHGSKLVHITIHVWSYFPKSSLPFEFSIQPSVAHHRDMDPHQGLWRGRGGPWRFPPRNCDAFELIKKHICDFGSAILDKTHIK